MPTNNETTRLWLERHQPEHVTRTSPALSVAQLAEYVDLVQPCYYHNLDNWAVIRQHANEVLEWFDCPAAWRPVVRVMAQGADYYGEEDWNKGA